MLNLGLFIALSPLNTSADVYNYQYLSDAGNGKVNFENGAYVGGVYYTGVLLNSAIHYLPVTYYGMGYGRSDGGWNYIYSTGNTTIDVSAFNFASVVALDSKLYSVENQLYNYYYTFRVDERVEAIEFAEELRSDKKEMSSLDFMPIKSSSDLRINLIKAEDPLTFSAKTRDDSLVLMEV